MSTYSYKFVFLGDPDVTVNQSRGINIQFNGYVPVTCKNSTYLSNLIAQKKQLNVQEAAKSGDIVMLFRDVRYRSNGTVTNADDANYTTFIKTPGDHMFQGLTAMASDELQLIDENGSQRSTLSVELPLYDTMFGDRLVGGKTRIDGVLLYGQAYNPMFNDEYRQGDLESSVPVAIVVFAPSGSGDKPEIDPSNEAKAKTVLRIGINVISGEAAGAEIADTPEFRDWQKLAGTMHIVNDGLATSASFIVRDHDIDIEPISDDFAVSGEKTIDVATRMFFSEDPEGTDTDLNVDFGSPARLNVMNYDEISEGKKPQMMISKVKNWEDENGYKHASWDGIVESWYSESGQYRDEQAQPYKMILGSVYDLDYVAKDNPAVNIFSDGRSYITTSQYAPYSPGAVSEGTNLSPGMQERWDERTSFASAPALFSSGVIASNKSIVINSKSVRAAGSYNVIGSSYVELSSNPNLKDIESKMPLYQGLIANSRTVKIEDCEEEPDHVPYTRGGGAYTHEPHFSLLCKTYANNNVIGSREVLISSRYPYYDYNGDSHPDGYRLERTFIANCDRVNLNMSDRVIALGLKGVFGNGSTQKAQKRFYTGASKNTYCGNSGDAAWTNGFTQDSNETEYSLSFNTFTRTEDSVFIGGSVNTTDVKGVVVIGTGCPRSNYYGANIVEGFRATDEVKPIGHAYMVEHSAIIGLDNRISTIVPEAIKGNWTRPWCKGRVSNVYEIGKTLINDVRQQRWIEDQFANVSFLLSDQNNGRHLQKDPATVILGSKNAYYCQKGKWVKQVIIGGFSGKGVKGTFNGAKCPPWWNHNSFEFKSEWNSPSRNALAVQDMKGRQVMYTSIGVNLGFIKGARDQEAYENYRYSDMGNINFFKLYRLLRHLRYDYETGYVRFDMTDESTQPESSYPVKFHNQGKDYQGNASTCLADLVDDAHCYYPHFPMGNPFSNGGGTDNIGPGGGDCTVYGNSGGGGGDTPVPGPTPVPGNGLTFGGRTYPTVIIGNLEWTTVNLNYDDATIGDTNTGDSSPEGHNYYTVNPEDYGRLYNKEAVSYINGLLVNLGGGWRVPSNSDYQNLCSTFGQPIGTYSDIWELKDTTNFLAGSAINFKLSGIWNPTNQFLNNSVENQATTDVATAPGYENGRYAFMITEGKIRIQKPTINSDYKDALSIRAVRTVVQE